jgi:hypothetical protein
MNITDCWPALVLGISLTLGFRMLWQAFKRVHQ